MPFDFQAAVAAAEQAVAQGESSGGSNYTYPLVYPSKNNTITVRPLFNPASGQILRLVNRHEKVPCYRTYGIECPICKVMQEVKDVTGQDPFGRTKSSKSRGIAFAQYVSSTTPIEKGGNRGTLQSGEIILFMFPWSVYQSINSMIQACAQTPTGMDQAFNHATQGLYVQITVDNSFKYTTTQVPYASYPLVNPDGTQMTDEQFTAMLEGMESLFEQVCPSTITDEVDKQVREYADAINREFIAPRTATQGVPAGTAPVTYGQPAGMPPQQTPSAPGYNNPAPNYAQSAQTPPGVNYPPQTSTVPPTPPEVTSTNPVVQGGAPTSPACFGKHIDNNPNCICCPDEMMCIEKSKG